MDKVKVIEMLEDLRLTCFNIYGDEINPETISAIDMYLQKLEK